MEWELPLQMLSPEIAIGSGHIPMSMCVPTTGHLRGIVAKGRKVRAENREQKTEHRAGHQKDRRGCGNLPAVSNSVGRISLPYDLVRV